MMNRMIVWLLLTMSGGPLAVAETFEPVQSPLPVPAPEEAVVLLDGSPDHGFVSKTGGDVDWPLEQGALVSSPGEGRSNHIASRLHFRDADLHVEFMLPEQGPGNSGIYIHGHYELQIFNSSAKQKPSQHDAGAIYGFAPPLVQAARPPGEWQVYDIRYRAPQRNAEGDIVQPAVITAWLNGQRVQDHFELGEPRSVYHPFRYRTTPYLKTIAERQQATSVGPVFLQDHGNPVRFRNVWIRPLDDQAFLYEPR